MAKTTEFAKAVIGKDRMDKIGTYTESTGGGTPLPKGEKLKDHPEAERAMQPRDEGGRFTYNSANAKELKYGPSRGKTVPPFLRGVRMTYVVKAKTSIVFEGEVYYAGKDITAKELVEAFRQYKSESGFGSLMSDISKKRGRRSKLEKVFIEKGKGGTVAKEGETVVVLGYDDFREVEKSLPKEKKSAIEHEKVYKEKSAPVKETPKTSETARDFDINMAKNDPMKFADEYGAEMSEILDMPEMKGVSESALLSVIADGGIKSVAHAKQLAKEF